QDARCWSQVMTELGDTFRVIAPDLPGVADSAAKVRDGRKRTITHQVAALLDALGVDDVALVGHDVGGQVVFAAPRDLDGHPSALSAGFDWYRAFATDSIDNADRTGGQITTPLLYARGEHEPGELDAYVDGLRRAGCTNITTAVIEGSGHFTPTEQPAVLASV